MSLMYEKDPCITDVRERSKGYIMGGEIRPRFDENYSNITFVINTVYMRKNNLPYQR